MRLYSFVVLSVVGVLIACAGGCRSAVSTPVSVAAASSDRAAVELLDRIDAGIEPAASRSKLAMVYLEQGRNTDALDRAKESLQLDPDNVTAHLVAARVLYWQDSYDDAITHATAAATSDPACGECAVWLAYALAAAGRDQEAAPWWDRGAALDPQNAGLRINVGINRARLNRHDDAAAEYRKAIELPDHPDEVYIRLRDALAKQEKTDEARRAVEDGLAKFPQSSRLLRSVAWYALDADENEKGLEMAERAAKADPTDPRAHRVHAEALVRNDRLDESLAAWTRTIELDPNDAEARQSYSSVLRTLKRYDEAEAQLQKLVDDGAADADAYFRLAAIKKEIREDPKAAAPLIDMAAALGRDQAEILEYAGDVHDALADLDRAYYYYREAALVDPKASGAIFGMGYALMVRYGKAAEAVEQFARVVELDPTNSPAWQNLAEANIRLARWEEATRVSQEGLKHSDNPELKLRAGIALNELKRSNEAIPLLRAAAEQMKDDARPWNELGVALLRTKDAGAAEAFDKAMACPGESWMPRFNRALIAIDERDWARAESLRDWLRTREASWAKEIDERIRKAKDKAALETTGAAPEPVKGEELKPRF